MKSNNPTTTVRYGALANPVAQAALPFVIGCASGMIATVCIHPLDLLKTRMQLLKSDPSNNRTISALSVVRDIVKQGRISSLYDGLSAGLLRQVMYGASRLGLFFTFEDILTRRAAQKGQNVTFVQRALAGLTAGGIGSFIGCPAEVVLIRMQADGLKPLAQQARYNSAVDALVRIARTEGVLSFWAGAYPTVIRAMCTNIGQLSFFSETQYQLERHTNFSKQNRTVLASGIAGCGGAILSLPLDLVKTRLQNQTPRPDGSFQYKGMLDCAAQVFRTEGILAFYRGLGLYLSKIGPHSMITLIIADNIRTFLQ